MKNKILIIAEISANHNNDLNLTKKTIEAIKKSGADAVKIQTYKPDSLTLKLDDGYFKPRTKGLWKGYTPWELYSEASLPYEWHREIKELCDEWQPYLFRTHIIKLNPGGYFPPHRDYTNSNFESFRLIMPLFNCSYPSVTFISDDKILNWNEGKLYFLDTVKVHQLFNCSPQPSYWLIMNIGTNEETIQKVISSVAIT